MMLSAVRSPAYLLYLKTADIQAELKKAESSAIKGQK
jgi:hypothetical protein